MLNTALYAITVIIWGTTWYAIHLQIGDVAAHVSILFRFILACSVMFTIVVLFKKRQPMQPIDHAFCVLQGLCLFCLNFLTFYTASHYVSSGLLSVIFSLATVFNSLNAWLWFGKRPSRRVLVGAIMGVIGIGLLFSPSIQLSTDNQDWLFGLALAICGTYLFSNGNMVSVRHQNRGLKPLTTNAWSMLYGVIMMAVIIWLQDVPIVISQQTTYWIALVYLAIPGTVIAFTTYLLLIGRIGSDKAAYSTVLYPLIALSISTLFEGQTWDWHSWLGLMFVMLGNIVIFARAFKRPTSV